MEEPIPYSPDYELHFYTKLKNFELISKELQFLILHQYKDYLRYEIRHEEERLEYASKDERIPGGSRNIFRSSSGIGWKSFDLMKRGLCS